MKRVTLWMACIQLLLLLGCQEPHLTREEQLLFRANQFFKARDNIQVTDCGDFLVKVFDEYPETYFVQWGFRDRQITYTRSDDGKGSEKRYAQRGGLSFRQFDYHLPSDKIIASFQEWMFFWEELDRPSKEEMENAIPFSIRQKQKTHCDHN